MHPTIAKARQIQAAEKTAASVAGLQEQNARIEAKIDLVLEHLGLNPADQAGETESEAEQATGADSETESEAEATAEVAGSNAEPATQAPRTGRPKTGGR